MSDAKPKYDGVKVKIGDQEFIMPSLSVGQAEKFWPQILNLDMTGVSKADVVGLMPQKFDDMVAVIHAALSRNYADLTVEYVKDSVSITQLRQLMAVVMGQSGFDRGESQPAADSPVVH